MERKATGTPGGWLDVLVRMHTGIGYWFTDRQYESSAPFYWPWGNADVFALPPGTRIDTPFPFLPGGASVDALPPGGMAGLARMKEIGDSGYIRPIEPRRCDTRKGERVLSRTVYSRRCWQSHSSVASFVCISHEAAKYLNDLVKQAASESYRR